MKRLATIVAVVILFLPAVSLGQEQRTNISTERKSIDWFYADANSQPKTLLLKLLQFTAPYPGYYQQTSLDTNGNALTARVVPDWAVQGSVNAKLDGALLGQIRQMLAQLNLPSTLAGLEPQQGQLHSAIVFYDGMIFCASITTDPFPRKSTQFWQFSTKSLWAPHGSGWMRLRRIRSRCGRLMATGKTEPA